MKPQAFIKPFEGHKEVEKQKFNLIFFSSSGIETERVKKEYASSKYVSNNFLIQTFQ